jgi:hypothetical protein
MKTNTARKDATAKLTLIRNDTPKARGISAARVRQIRHHAEVGELSDGDRALMKRYPAAGAPVPIVIMLKPEVVDFAATMARDAKLTVEEYIANVLVNEGFG